MEKLLLTIANRLQPDLESATELDRAAVCANLFGLLYASPLAFAGIVWLLNFTDLALLRREWPTLALFLMLAFLLHRLRFFVLWATREFPLSAGGAMDGLVTWAGALLFGPTALWIELFLIGSTFVRRWRAASSTSARWDNLRNFALDVTTVTPGGLVALLLYQRWGGVFPLPGLTTEALGPALYATLTWALLSLTFWLPYLVYTAVRVVRLPENPSFRSLFLLTVGVGLLLPAIIVPFGILAAGLYTQNGLGVFLFFGAGLLLVSLLARRLSQAVESSQQRSRELARLEQLSRAIINAPPDASMLPALLKEHVPSMFPMAGVVIRSFRPSQKLVSHPREGPEGPPKVSIEAWEWIRTTGRARHFAPGTRLPWDQKIAQQPVVVAPIFESETREPIGGVYLELRRKEADATQLLPAVQSLGAQISSALHSAEVYAQTLVHQKIEHELALAGEIQASFLPRALPQVAGWQLAATLVPARQTSGDFYDVISLPNGRLGLLVADVADKGTGAALYMALSRTLIRTYAVEHHARPDYALRVANNRILTDAQVDLFVTVFYAVLNPLTGELTYCNAGHNPPYLLDSRDGAVQRLEHTGMPLGIFRGETWERRTVRLEPDDLLLLYTDGITEAQDVQENFFGEERMLAVARARRGRSAQEIQDALMEAVRAFTDTASQFDDITLMVLARERTG